MHGAAPAGYAPGTRMNWIRSSIFRLYIIYKYYGVSVYVLLSLQITEGELDFGRSVLRGDDHLGHWYVCWLSWMTRATEPGADSVPIMKLAWHHLLLGTFCTFCTAKFRRFGY